MASCAPTRVLMCLAAQAPNAADPPALLTSATMMPSITRKTKMPAFHGSLMALRKPTRHGVFSLANLTDNDVVDGVDRVEPREQKRTHDDADEQRRVGFLGDKRQDNGDDGWHERPEGSDKLHVLPNACRLRYSCTL